METEEVRFRESVILYPNPSTDNITIRSLEEPLQEILITDLQGKRIQQMKLTNFNESQQVDISTLAKGVYFVTILSNQNKVVKRLIVQ